MSGKEEFNPKKYEEELSSVNIRGPFTIWSGKGWRDTPQFPPHWGHPWRNIPTIFEAIYRWNDIGGIGDIKVEDDAKYYEHPYVLDNNGEVVLSVTNLEAVAFMGWLSNARESGGTTGLLYRNNIDIKE